MSKHKKWCLIFIGEFISLLIIIIVGTIVIDPLFHYHRPLNFLGYPINNQRYQNDGILRNFKYDAIIAGTSMTENFKTSQLDSLLGTKSVKVPLNGASLREVNEMLKRAITYNDSIKYIIRGIDYSYLQQSKNYIEYAGQSYPYYLYDDDLSNDIDYILNKDIFLSSTLDVLINTFKGFKTTSFDEYCRYHGTNFGARYILSDYKRLIENNGDNNASLTSDITKIITDNVNQNLRDIAINNPNIEFYYFYTPYSIIYFSDLADHGQITKQIETEELTTKLLLECDNIHLFSFFNELDIITNLDNYRDIYHYGEWINAKLLESMISGKGELTKDNYKEYYEELKKIYLNYDYESLFT